MHGQQNVKILCCVKSQNSASHSHRSGSLKSCKCCSVNACNS